MLRAGDALVLLCVCVLCVSAVFSMQVWRACWCVSVGVWGTRGLCVRWSNRAGVVVLLRGGISSVRGGRCSKSAPAIFLFTVS